jgi:hypothetical protein
MKPLTVHEFVSQSSLVDSLCCAATSASSRLFQNAEDRKSYLRNSRSMPIRGLDVSSTPLPWRKCSGRKSKVRSRAFSRLALPTEIHYADFVDMLNAMRFGRLNTHTVNEFKKLSRVVQYEDGIEPTELCVLCVLSLLTRNVCLESINTPYT